MDRLSRVNFKISDRKAWSKKVNHEKSAEVIVGMDTEILKGLMQL